MNLIALNLKQTFKSLFKIQMIISLGLVLALMISESAPASTYALTSQTQTARPTQGQICRSELFQIGYSSIAKQDEFCLPLRVSQWNCSLAIIKKYHSLEMAKEICLTATVSESSCYVDVINRNFDPYVAKRVCRLKRS